MGYLDNRKEIVKKLHNIYCDEIPVFLYKYLEVPEIARLHGVSQHCGLDYVQIDTIKPKFYYSRLDHSLGVALILWNFTKNKKQTIAGLLHDISIPVLGHVVDFLYGDSLNQEHTEHKTKDIIESSKDLKECLIEDKINIEDVWDYKIYPLADNKTPKLSGDRFEYNLIYRMVDNYNSWTLDDIEKMYNNITTIKNEEEIEEISFKSYEYAKQFGKGALYTGKTVALDEDWFCMQFQAQILKLMLENGEITEDELYKTEESDLINRIVNSKKQKVRDAWKHFNNMDKVKKSGEPVSGKFCAKLDVKKRYVDPLIEMNSSCKRLSEIDYNFKKEIKEFIGEHSKNYVYTDFSFED